METPTWVWGDLDKGNTSQCFDLPSFSRDTDAVGCTSNKLLLILITPGQTRWGRRQGRWEGTHVSHRWRTSPAEIPTNRDSLVVQWLRLQAPKAGNLGSIPGQGIRSHMPHMTLQTTLTVRIPQLKIPHAAMKIEDPRCWAKMLCSQINK